MKMNRKTAVMLAYTTAATVVALLISARPADNIITRNGKTTIVNTRQLGSEIKGFKGNTPVRIFIEKDKVVKIETLPNMETPKFFHRASSLLNAFNGMTVSQAAKTDVDGVTGATFSSKALKKNIKLGLEYYQKHK